jgi:hypothetical protein
LEDNIDALHLVAKTLFEKETVESEEFAELMEQAGLAEVTDCPDKKADQTEMTDSLDKKAVREEITDSQDEETKQPTVREAINEI